MVERPDGTVELRWSSSATPSVLRDADGAEVLPAPGEGAPPSVPVRDVDADGQGGPVHALLAVPTGAGGSPLPAVFLLHGGPMSHDADVFDPERAAWVDAGYAVVQVNYRGSTGYGAPWQDAIVGRPGLTELEDVAAVRDALVAEGVVDPARCVVAGGSWGGYLTLLALGTQPDAWACGVAAVPVAHYASAYADEMEALRELDRTLFGGSPSEVPDVWRASDPYTHVDQVRAPVLVLAGANDPRCPLRQIEEYLDRPAGPRRGARGLPVRRRPRLAARRRAGGAGAGVAGLRRPARADGRRRGGRPAGPVTGPPAGCPTRWWEPSTAWST